MGTMTSPARSFRRHFGVRPGINIEGMNREDLIVEAIFRMPELEDIIPTDWIPDDATCRRVGWLAVKHIGIAFEVGRRLLELTTHDGYLLPPPEFQLCRATEPTPEEVYRAPYLQPWSLVLFQSGNRPARWDLSGRVYHREWECDRHTFRLLYLHPERKMARTNMGWFRLGRRFAT
jgi:hypothetical protein